MSNRKKVGLALGSGGIRGLAHIGVIKKLVEHNIPIDYISGSSVGAWVGAHYALFKDIERLEKYTIENKKEKLLSFLEPSFFDSGLIKGERLEKLLDKWLEGADFSDTKIPISIVATDLVSGEFVAFNKGKISKAARASMSVPTLFNPVKMEGKFLVDGGLSNPVPDEILRKMGADIVISVNLDNFVKNEKFLNKKLSTFSGTISRSLNVMRYNLSKYSTSSSDIVLEPYTPAIGVDSFADYFKKKVNDSFVKNGEIETEKYIKDIKNLLL